MEFSTTGSAGRRPQPTNRSAPRSNRSVNLFAILPARSSIIGGNLLEKRSRRKTSLDYSPLGAGKPGPRFCNGYSHRERRGGQSAAPGRGLLSFPGVEEILQ